MLHFGLRGCKDQRELQWGDVVLKSDSEGKQYLEYFVERQTKTSTGENPRNKRQVKTRTYQNKTTESAERDPVQVYKAYKDKRLENMLKPDSPFYLAVNYFKTEGELKSEGSKWFKSQPIGVKKLNSLMKEMTETEGISVKTLVQKIQVNNVPPNQIVHITGHKNLQSINNYSSLREETNGEHFENLVVLNINSECRTASSLQSHFTEAHSSASAR